MEKRSLDSLKNKTLRSEEDLAQMIVRVALTASADVIMCATETGALATKVHGQSQHIHVIAAITIA
jgi:hypothetical protein